MSKEPLNTDEWKKGQRKRKNTKVFCKGVEGRYHQLEFVHAKCDVQKRTCRPNDSTRRWLYRAGGNDDRWICFHELKCSGCGKVMWDQEFRCPDRPEDV